MGSRGVQGRGAIGLGGWLGTEMREKTVIQDNQGHGTFEALHISWSPVSHLPEGLTLCDPSLSSLRENNLQV